MVVGEFTQEAELVVIGGGPAGYAAAFAAAEGGTTTTLVDPRGALGGTCLHAGCIPSKTLLYLGELLQTPKRAANLGVTFPGEPTVDLVQLREWMASTVATLASGLANRAKKLGIEILQGQAVFEDAKNLTVQDGAENQRIKFRRAVIATGLQSAALHPMFSAFDETQVISAAQAMSLSNVPERLLVMVGSDAYGIELAAIYAALGSAVTVVGDGSCAEELLGGMDADLLRPLVRGLKDEWGIEIALGAVVSAAVPMGMDGMRLEFAGDKPPAETVVDKVIVATAGVANTAALELTKAGVEVDGETGYVLVDETLKTSNPRIFAVGDVTGGVLLANRALRDGRAVGRVIAGQVSDAIDGGAVVPEAIFTDPQVAWCGVTERQAQAAGLNFKVAKLPWGASGRAVSMGRAREGLTKIIYDVETQMVLGVGIVGMGATEMIGAGVLALEMGAEVGDVAAVLLPHPTMSELLTDVAGNAGG